MGAAAGETGRELCGEPQRPVEGAAAVVGIVYRDCAVEVAVALCGKSAGAVAVAAATSWSKVLAFTLSSRNNASSSVHHVLTSTALTAV